MKRASGMTFIDLFCGCGGLSYGLEMAGHECLLGVDMEPAAIKSFQRNHPKAEAWCGDIKKLDGRTLKKLIGVNKVDMVVGGPPCQGFSTVGKGEVEDDRNQLFREFVRVVKVTKPKIVLFENVTGMVAKKNAAILAKVFHLFEKLGYTMEARVLSAEEFGVPEVRRRTIIMGVLGGECRFPKPTHGVRGTKKVLTVSQALKNLKALDGKIYNHEPKLAQIKNPEDRERLKFIPAGRGIRYQADEKQYLPKKLWFDVNWDELREGRFRQTRLQRLPLDKPSPTILTARTSYYHPTEPRFLTPREAASCQSFPNDFIFEGSQTAQFRQIGNAVPPMLGKILGEEIKKITFSRATKKKIQNRSKVVVNNVFDYALPTHM
ncbi:MAG: DNA cytosine methyltransferase [Bacteriovoracaceae bacterium]|nr:DNA cytosine methyltransferase [Bacteriovoracaceae bacterium]